MRFELTLLLFGIVVQFGFAQNKTVLLKHYTAQQGLSDNQVTCMLRDKQGFMWIGTKDGLNRFDGREFYVFRHDVNNPSSIGANYITSLACDNDSVLWVGTASAGFCAFDFRTQKFTTYNKQHAGIKSNNINVIRFDKLRNLIWIGYNNGGMQLFDVRTRKLNGLYNVSGNSTYDIFLSDTMAYVATIVNSLKKVSSPNAFKKHKDITQAAITINCIVNASNGRLYCGAWDNALHEFDYNTKLIKSYIFDGKDTLNFSADEIISIAEDENGILWCGTKNAGVLFFDLKTKTFTGTYKYVYNITTRVNCIYRDDYNRMWIGSQQGIFVYDRLMNQFEQTYFYNNIDKINCKVHQRLLVTGGTEYVVADCGLFYKKVNEVDYTFKNFRYEHDDLQLTSIYCDNAGTIFIGSNKTIFTLDTLKMELSIIPVAKQSVTQGFLSAYASRINSITGLQLDNKNYVINSFYGHFVSIVDLERKNYFMLKRTKPNNIENLVRKIYIDSKNRIWICGASKGLSQFYLPVDFHPDSFPVCDTLKHPVIITSQTWENEKSKTPFAINNVYDILENKDGSFWLTSQGNGLFKFYPDNKSVPFIPINGDYKSLQGIARGNANTVWIITSKGVLSYNTQTAQYKLYDAAHGIPESTAGYFFNENDSTLCAGFNGGFISFNPRKILEDTEKPRVNLTRLWVMDVPSDSLLTQPLNLKYKSNFLKFYLSSNCFSDNQQVTYMYRLTGIDNKWRSNDFSPYITYTNLPHGKYELHYKAINSDGCESTVGILSIVITPPFYRTVWFYSIVLLTLVVCLYMLYRYRIKQIFKLQEVRNKIARDLHDDIGSTLGSIHLYSQIANSKLNASKAVDVKSILEKIENASAEIIDKTGDVVWAAKASNDTLKSLVIRMEGFATSVLGAAEISFHIEYDSKLDDMKLEMTQRKNIFLIYKEAIHNSIKYASCSEVIIKISKQGEHLIFAITDNGKGFNVNGVHPYNGNGIKNMKLRADEIKGRFNIFSAPGMGTTIEINI